MAFFEEQNWLAYITPPLLVWQNLILLFILAIHYKVVYVCLFEICLNVNASGRPPLRRRKQTQGSEKQVKEVKICI